LQQAIDPSLGLVRVIQNWNTLAADLAEPNRHRVPHVQASFRADEAGLIGGGNPA
jgi:hypothetical protein